MTNIIATVHSYNDGQKSCLGYEIPYQDGIHTLRSWSDESEKIHFIVAENHVVVSDDEDLNLYVNHPGRVKFDGEEIINGEVSIG